MVRDYEAELRQTLESVEGGIPDTTADSSAHTETTAPSEAPVVETSETKPFSASKLFVHHDTHPIVLDIKLMDKYGTDWFGWDPETLWSEILDDFHVPSISDHVKSKIQAVKTIHISDWCFTKWEVFCPVTQALNNNIPDFEIMRKPTLSQLFAGVDMMTLVRDDVPFSPEVQQWCAAALLDVGVIYAPQPIAFCQDEILQLQQLRDIPCNPAPIKEKFQHLIRVPAEEVVLLETPTDVQVAKLIIARDYLALRRGQMTQQLRALR